MNCGRVCGHGAEVCPLTQSCWSAFHLTSVPVTWSQDLDAGDAVDVEAADVGIVDVGDLAQLDSLHPSAALFNAMSCYRISTDILI